MDTMDKLFHSELAKEFSFKKVGVRLITKKLEQRGLTLSKQQIENIEIALENIEAEAETITITDIFPDSEEDIILDVSEEEIDALFDEISENVKNIAIGVTSAIAKTLLRQLVNDAPQMLEEHSSLRSMFEKRHNKKWKRAINLLEMLVVIALEVGEEFNKEFRPAASAKKDYVFEALIRLHARSCQIAYEVLVLLRAGFADGAHARWRTMHEVSVAASFLAKNGVDLAERYLLHHHIESYKGMLQHQKYFARLKHNPLSHKEIEHMKGIYDKLLDRFGQDYRNSYGWAATTLLKRDPNFSDIEEAVGLDHWRPYYKMASHNVHANPKGITFKLGWEGTNLLLAGPSDRGLADPGHGTAISLAQVTTNLLLTEPNIDRLVLCRVMLNLSDRIGRRFLKIQVNKTGNIGKARRNNTLFKGTKTR